jgi:hypothetical protein
MTSILVTTLADARDGSRVLDATITATATRARSAGRNLTLPEPVTVRLRRGELTAPLILEEPDGTWAWKISVRPTAAPERRAFTGTYRFSGAEVTWADLEPVDPKTLVPMEPIPPNVLQILAEAEQAVTAAETAAQNSANAQASAAGFASAAQGYAAEVIPMADAAVQSAVAEIVIGENAAPAEELDEDEFTVRFDDGDPFIQANESLGIHDTKIAGAEHVDIEQSVHETGWQFCYYRRDASGKIYRLFGLRDDGTFYPPGLGLDQTGPAWVQSGDSMSLDLASRMATLTGLTWIDLAIGGERSYDIAGRTAANPLWIAVDGGTIPTSGSVFVTPYYYNGPTSTYIATTTLLKQGNKGVNPCRLKGVEGTLTWSESDGRYRFTRSTAGTAVAVPYKEPLSTFAQATYRSYNQVFQLGRNNATDLDRVLEDTHAMLLWQTGARKKFLVVGIMNSTAEIPGTQSYAAILALNAALKKEYGSWFVDMRRKLIDDGMSMAGLTPTSQDLADIANDTIPTSLRIAGDPLHLNATAKNVQAQVVYDRLKLIGHI